MMIGLDSYAATKESFVGIDWLNLTSGIFKTAGGAATALESGTPGGTQSGATTQAQAAADKTKLEAAKQAAEQSATFWKLLGVGTLVVIGGYFLLRKPAAPSRALTHA